MKKYLKNRNESLLNKLFERQGIHISLEEQEGDPPFNTEPESGGQMDSNDLKTYENNVLGGIRDMIRQGASPQQMERFLVGVDAAIMYGFAGDDRLYTSPFTVKSLPLAELGVPEMTAWQALEDSEGVREDRGVDDDDLNKITKSLKPATAVLKTIDDPDEAESILRHVLKNIKSLVGDRLSNQEIALAVKSILKDMTGGAEAEPQAQTEPQAQKEVHILADPDDKE